MNTHLNHLKFEVEVLKTKIQDHDTGNIKTAIEVLEERIREEEKYQNQLLDSSYPDGDGYWK